MKRSINFFQGVFFMFPMLVLAQDYGKFCQVKSSCYDTNYPDIEVWASAGVNGGVPNVQSVKARLSSGDNIQAAINSGGDGVVLLENGTYIISSTLYLKSGVVLRGESKTGVKLSVVKKDGEAIIMDDDVSYAGLENLKLVFEALPNPPKAYRSGFQDGWYCAECFQNDEPNYDGSLLRINGNNNWVDNVDFINSGSDPVEIYGDHNTFRKSLVDNCYNKGGGGEGYFDLRGDYNLITGSVVRLIRHFSIQQQAKYNVVYKNRFEVDINFHNKDKGHNLIEQNEIIRPSWHSWGVFATGGAQYGHEPPGPGNIIVNNTCYDYREAKNEFDETNVIYTFNGYGDPKNTDWSMPVCGTFYAVNCEGVDLKPSIQFSSQTLTSLMEGDDLKVSVSVSDDHGISAVELYLDGELVRRDTHAPYEWGNEDGVLQNMNEGEYQLLAIVEDEVGQKAEAYLKINVVDYTESKEFTETFEKMTLKGWGSETYIGDHGFEWTVNAKGTENYIDDSKDIYFQSGTMALVSGNIPGGIASFSVECKNLWEDGLERTLELLVNGKVVGSSSHTGNQKYVFNLNHINIEGVFTLALRNASSVESNKTIAIDNLSWKSYGKEIVTVREEFSEYKMFIYPNPTTGKLQLSKTSLNWQIFNLSGEKVIETSETELDMSVFPKGLYLFRSGDKMQKIQLQ